MPEDPSINGRAVQWSDLSTNGRRIVDANIRDAGAHMPDQARAHAGRMEHSAKSTPGKVKTAHGVADSVVAKPVTLQTAANRREDLYKDAVDRRAAENPEDPDQVIPPGAGWYFEHHRGLAEAADRSGYSHDAAIVASGVMSPQNSPENERAAVDAIMRAKSSGSVQVEPHVVEHLSKSGIDVSQHQGKRVPYADLPTGTVAHLSNPRVRDSIDTDADLLQVSRGGPRENVVKAENVLEGKTPVDEAIDPHGAPKVWSYTHTTRAAVPESAAHVEFMGRVHQDALVRRGQIDKEQQALDLYPDQPQSELLSPDSHTVEDTWQNAATFDQPKTTVPGTKTSVFKAAGSLDNTYPVNALKTRENPDTGKRESAHPDARVKASSLQHAYNNRATQKAAEQLGRESGVTMPPVAVQEVGWTEMRKQAGKDAQHNAVLRGQEAPQEDTGQPVIPGLEGLVRDRRR